MVAPDRSSMGIDRRESMRLSLEQDDNDYDLEAMGISDGFRPPNVTASHNRTTSNSSQYRPPPRPSSATKPNHDSFALRHDGSMGAVPSRTPIVGSSAVPVTRSSSVSTEMAFVRPESPYRGPTGPSHPYQMYPQESQLARTASIATTSTNHVRERSYAGPNGPTHPYGMYPQYTVPEVEDMNGPSAIPPVPVGFPGRNDNYQRRLGPEGEEIAGIIGPDGHTEELPPYTQYPEEAIARKTRPNVQIPLTGAGGIGLATRNPEFASREDLSSPQSREDARSIISNSSHQVNMAAMNVSEKPEKKWQKLARRKACGVIPVWAFVLVGIAFLFFIIILATVLEVLKNKGPRPPKHRPGNDNDGVYQSIIVTTMTTTYDATPFTALPDGISTLPTGTFQLPVTTPSIAPSSCLVNTEQSNAWNCGIPPALPYQITVSDVPDSDDVTGAQVTFGYGNGSIDFLPYGAQPPIFHGPATMILVNDSKYPERGPAWFFQKPYDKLVILREDSLSPSNVKRDSDHDSISDFMGHKNVAQVGDKPWFCYWNRTLLEAFIYVNESSKAANLGPGAVSSGTATSTYASSVPTSSAQPSYYPSSGPTEDPEFLPCYPKVLKLEERRVLIGGSTVAPYCVQHIVNPDGTYMPYVINGAQVVINLNETTPESVPPFMAKRTQYESVEERGTDLYKRQSESSCGCVWLQQ